MSATPPLAYFWGEDAFGIERAARDCAAHLAPPRSAMEVWRTSLDDDADGEGASTSAARRRMRALDDIEQHLAIAPLFGGGTLVRPATAGRAAGPAEARDRFVVLVGQVPPGNALCVTDLTAGGAAGPAAEGVLHDAVRAAGGVVQEFQVPAAGRLEAWLMERAAELSANLEPAAARLLAERVGAHVREARRRSAAPDRAGQRRAGEAGAVSSRWHRSARRRGGAGQRDHPRFHVGIPRRGRQSAQERRRTQLAERLLAAGAPLPVLVAQLHRRLRDLVLVREHLDAGTTPPQIVKRMKLQPFRADKLAEQARAWTAPGPRGCPGRPAGARPALQGHLARRLDGADVRGGGCPGSPGVAGPATRLGLRVAGDADRHDRTTDRRQAGTGAQRARGSDRGLSQTGELDQTGNWVARSWTTASDSMAKTQRPSGMSRTSSRSGSR